MQLLGTMLLFIAGEALQLIRVGLNRLRMKANFDRWRMLRGER